MAVSEKALIERSPEEGFAVVRFGTDSLQTSGIKSGDTQITSIPTKVYWLTVSDTAALAIELNNSIGGGGTDKWGVDLPADGYGHFIFDPPLPFSAGVYLDVSTVTCKVTIGYM